MFAGGCVGIAWLGVLPPATQRFSVLVRLWPITEESMTIASPNKEALQPSGLPLSWKKNFGDFD